jgi:hypothetical protein
MKLPDLANHLTLINSIGVVEGGVAGCLISALLGTREPRDILEHVVLGITLGWAAATGLWLLIALVQGQL